MHGAFGIGLIAAVLIAIGALSVTSANATVILSGGTFIGASGHKAGGSVEIIKDGDVVRIVLKKDFTPQNAPTPRLAWGNDSYKRGTVFGKLDRFKGMQEYLVPASTDLAQFNEFWIWCEKYDVGLAVAKLHREMRHGQPSLTGRFSIPLRGDRPC